MSLPLALEAERPVPRVWQFADAEFDEIRFELRVAGQLRALETKPLAILHQLLCRGGDLVTKAELLLAVWPGVAVVEQSLTTAVSKLRAALDDRDWQVVRSVRGQGYRIGVPVRVRAPAQPQAVPLAIVAGERVATRAQWVFERRLQAAAAPPGSGEVWLCRHARLDERRVFKFATTTARRDELKREAAISRVLREALGERPDLVPVLDCNFEAASFHLESPFAGPDLVTWAAANGGLGAIPLAERIAIVAAVARTLAAAHDVGVLHRDVKPGNVLVDNGVVRLVDFGSGHVVNAARLAAMTQSASFGGLFGGEADAGGATVFTFRYAAPEILAGGASTALADVFSLGVLLYQMVAADFGRPLAIGWERDIADPLLRADIADAACGDPERRLPAAAALADRLERLDARRTEAAHREREREEHRRLEQFAATQARAAEAARAHAAHATALARRTRIGAAGATLLAVVALLCWGAALHADRLARAQGRRAELASGAGWQAVSGLTGAIVTDLLDRPGVPLDLRRALLEHAERVVGEMSRAVPDSERGQRIGAGALDGFANIDIHQGNFARGVSIAREAAAMQRALLLRHPRDAELLLNLSQSERWIGDGALEEGDLPGALAAYQAGRDALLHIGAPAGTPSLAERIAAITGAMGDVELRRGENAAALATYRGAETTLEAVSAPGRIDPEWQMALSVAWEKIGDALDAAGNAAAARQTYEKDLAIRRRMVALDPSNMRFQRNLAIALGDVGEETTTLGDGHGALPWLLEGAAIYDRLAASDPSNFRFKVDLADSEHDIGVAETRAGEFVAARTSLNHAVQDAAALFARSPEDGELRKALEAARADAAKLPPP